MLLYGTSVRRVTSCYPFSYLSKEQPHEPECCWNEYCCDSAQEMNMEEQYGQVTEAGYNSAMIWYDEKQLMCNYC